MLSLPCTPHRLAAALQHERADNANPLLIRIDVKAGHGAGKPTAKVIDEAVDKYGWASHTLGLKMYKD
jgi:prolyl oligopeptidase